MRIFLYEWITGGGLVEETGSLPASLLVEGEAMLSALASDFAALPGASVSIVRDARLDPFSLSCCEVVEVHSTEHQREQLTHLARLADYSMVIAPEFDGILAKTVQLVRREKGKLLAPSDAFIALTANKHDTAEYLGSAGLNVPQARILDADVEKLPKDFPYPAVLKPLDGAGSQDTYLLNSHHDTPPPHPWPRRLERYYAGVPASVAFLCGPNQCLPLPACRQHLTDDGRLGYVGGSLLWETELARRATELAGRAISALPFALGYVGVDLVLGKAQDGSEDVVIEVNPRVTTSYVGLRAMSESNLAEAMLQIAAGEQATLGFRRDPLEFSSAGMVRRPW